MFVKINSWEVMRDFSLFNRAAKETANVTDKKCGKIARKVKNWRQFEAGCGDFGTLFVICIICLQMMKNENFRWILQTMANSASMMSFKSKGCSQPKVLCSESSLLVSFDFCCKDQLYQL